MAHTPWGYTGSNGPKTWATDFPIAKEGKNQSPVDIDTSLAKFDDDLNEKNPLTTNYKQENELKITNNGHSVMAQITKDSELTGGPLKNTYRLEQFHLHWGSTAGQGSEHTIDGKSYDAELHLVHWNAKKYDSFANAANKPDGLAVLGIMIMIGDDDNIGFKPISDSLSTVQKIQTDSKITKHDFDPSSLLPDKVSDYWTYQGSLTTPPLYESVQWIVFKNPVEYSKAQFEALRSLQSSDKCPMQDNFRPPLPLGDRPLRASFRAD